MRTVLEILKLSTDYLQKKNIQHARRQAEELLGEALNLGRMGLYMEHARPLTEQELEKCRTWLKRRGQGEPLQYIVGEMDFFNCHFKVNQDVLIPRQETEILVDKIAKELSSENLEGKVLWDICCGSGCIGIALKKKMPALKIVLSDISEKALAVAKENAASNGVEVEFMHGDLLTPFNLKTEVQDLLSSSAGSKLNRQKANFIVCNPPYISESEYENLEIEVKEFEPKLALVSGASGLEFYVRLCQSLPYYLEAKGKVWFEIGDGQGEEVEKIFNNPIWVRSIYEKDWSERHRFFFLEIE
jgi:release factor glutamine methyltransferase